MHASRTFTSIAMALFGAQAANAWLLEFWGTQSNCAKQGNTAADNEAGGLSGDSNSCMMAYYDLKAMKVTEWDDGCTVKVYAGDSLDCRGEVIYEKTKEEADEDGELADSDDGQFMCLTGLAGHPGPYYASYEC